MRTPQGQQDARASRASFPVRQGVDVLRVPVMPAAFGRLALARRERGGAHLACARFSLLQRGGNAAAGSSLRSSWQNAACR
jgi:hypothetical protein